MRSADYYISGLDNIIRRHRKGVASLYHAYGIGQAPLSPHTLLDAIIVYKQPFVDDLYAVVSDTQSFQGDTPEKSRFEELLRGALQTVKGIVFANQATPETKEATGNEDQEPRIFGIRKSFAIVIGAIMALVAVIVIAGKAKD